MPGHKAQGCGLCRTHRRQLLLHQSFPWCCQCSRIAGRQKVAKGSIYTCQTGSWRWGRQRGHASSPSNYICTRLTHFALEGCTPGCSMHQRARQSRDFHPCHSTTFWHTFPCRYLAARDRFLGEVAQDKFPQLNSRSQQHCQNIRCFQRVWFHLCC